MRILYKIIIFSFSFFVLSCSKWVEVKPVDRLREDELFMNSAGFMMALNGVYVELAHVDLYGQNMSAGMIDVFAQYYYLQNSTHTYRKFAEFAYTESAVKLAVDNSWKKAYELIANCNVILEKCGDAPSNVLPQPYYGIVKGEALALRALLHLDMLRLFGPIYREDSNALAIPYVDKTGYDISPLLSSEEVMQHIVSDLKTALSLLESDPVRTEGVRHYSNPNGTNDFFYRQYRLNYYAVKALLARSFLWEGNRVEAFRYADELLREVQSPEENIFPYVTFNAAMDVDKPDRMFSTEVMFSLYDIGRSEMYRGLFDVSLQATDKLSFSNQDVNETRVSDIYDDNNDFRRRIWQEAATGTIRATTNMKYEDIIDAPGRYMIPLIRLSEVLLIAAECSPDVNQGREYLNALRTARNCVSLAADDARTLQVEIGREFRREMIGEGQMFFFYKRNGYQSLPSHSSASINPTQTMVLNNYRVPLPDSEIALRQ
ncbi:RagB/SusD family nutrient uptake outer membrane protein [Sphingobacterium phlebotomi]|uniref:RagB/SusD family nutrient uptake outer membrane protein n=1 Tax=Sphingobacterium phlebotomi TaxID=2605433 RepID=A0A5D4HC55_9SPHI|nr:RagB/SusD family nutrient uptake outer membrane protein [Sphingobacterium phlebotomi]TYR37922.1 RagB/SusD family nutrient uptake outer membrane protein [Sphingobacterium phlebotomi]